jgi:7,8-dihydropterin-6-yl-methyl-4-(beta-D-ribofuranosyl)aminobenzene 5'-phosphate synthase
MDDSQVNKALLSEHGLSLYIETDKHNILFDTGQTDGFMVNADLLGINLENVDTVVISHGHYDHGGGLKSFLSHNRRAKVYIQSTAFQNFFSLREDQRYAYIGLDKDLLEEDQVHLIKGDFSLGENLHIIQNINENLFFPKANKSLFVQKNQDYVQDDFLHEQSLIISDDSHKVLIAGCAHRGILNIIKASQAYAQQPLDLVVGGFHLKSRHSDLAFSNAEIESLAHELKTYSKYYLTGHCTGDKPYKIIKKIMNHQIDQFYPGKQIDLSTLD